MLTFQFKKSDFDFFDNLINNDLSHKKVLIKKEIFLQR